MLPKSGFDRRQLLGHIGAGFPMMALLDLLSREDARAADGSAPALHFPAKAKHCVFLFMNGGPSQVDTFDYKPALSRFHDTPYRGTATIGSNGRPIGRLMQSPFRFRPYGQSGLMISDLYPNLSRFADDLSWWVEAASAQRARKKPPY